MHEAIIAYKILRKDNYNAATKEKADTKKII